MKEVFLIVLFFCLSARQSLFNTMELMSDKSAVPHVRRGHMVLLLPVTVCGDKRTERTGSETSKQVCFDSERCDCLPNLTKIKGRAYKEASSQR